MVCVCGGEGWQNSSGGVKEGEHDGTRGSGEGGEGVNMMAQEGPGSGKRRGVQEGPGMGQGVWGGHHTGHRFGEGWVGYSMWGETCILQCNRGESDVGEAVS